MCFNFKSGYFSNYIIFKLENLINSIKTFTPENPTLPLLVEKNWKAGFITIRFKDARGTPTTIAATNTMENFGSFECLLSSGELYHDLICITGNEELKIFSSIKEKGLSNLLFISKAILFY